MVSTQQCAARVLYLLVIRHYALVMPSILWSYGVAIRPMQWYSQALQHCLINLFTYFYVRQGGCYAVGRVCLSFCVQDCCKKSNQLISLKFHVMIGPYRAEELINFCWRSCRGYRFRIAVPLVTIDREIFWDFLVFLIQSPADFMTLGEVTDADKVMNPQHFGSNPADIRIRNRINTEIWFRIPDHFWLRLTSWRRFLLFEHSLVLCVFLCCM